MTTTKMIFFDKKKKENKKYKITVFVKPIEKKELNLSLKVEKTINIPMEITTMSEKAAAVPVIKVGSIFGNMRVVSIEKDGCVVLFGENARQKITLKETEYIFGYEDLQISR